MSGSLLEVENLTKHYAVRSGLIRRREIGAVRAVDGVSFTLKRGETLALVGESGCGKSTVARLALRLVEPSGGIVRFEGMDITDLRGHPMRKLRRRMQIVFQDPYASLNPRMQIGAILEEPLILHGIGDPDQRALRVKALLDLVGLPRSHASRYPHEFSGGQRQRIGIARALALEPSLVVCDEPVSALDVSIQAQVINLMKDLQVKLGLSYLFIAHDLAVVKHMADRVAVMYLGRIVEIGAKSDVFGAPRHPYTRLLLDAIPRPDPHHRIQVVPSGELPSPLSPPDGCHFHPRCAFATPICRSVSPELRELPNEHASACHHSDQLPEFTVKAAAVLADNAARRLDIYATRRNMPRGVIA